MPGILAGARLEEKRQRFEFYPVCSNLGGGLVKQIVLFTTHNTTVPSAQLRIK